jgi:DNA-binding transcriptional MerR regulator
MDQKEQLLTIQQLSLKLKIPKPTLRFWEKELDDILIPQRTKGGQRRYTFENVITIKEIKKLKETGMSLVEIKRKLSNSGREYGDHSNSMRVSLLADRVVEVVKTEVYRFFEELA